MPCPTPPLDNHDVLKLGLMDAGRRMRAAADDPGLFPDAREGLVAFCFEELVPHLEDDERWLREASSCSAGGLLADAMRTEARAMTGAAYELVGTANPCEAMATTRVLHTLLAAHAHHQELLVAAGGHAVVPQPRSRPGG
ncbi:MAG TPA: hypothetical protein VFZ64_02000 [Nocardioidaceae bacterium]